MVGGAFSGSFEVVVVSLGGRGCLLDEVDWVPVTLENFIEVSFFSLPCYGGATVIM